MADDGVEAKRRHGQQLVEAMAVAGADRESVADATGRDVKTVTNWRSGKTLPDHRDRTVLRQLFPGYDEDGSPFERALGRSALPAWRRQAVLSEYERHLHEQAAEDARTG